MSLIEGISPAKLNFPISGTLIKFDKIWKTENHCEENFKGFLDSSSRQRTTIKGVVSRNLKSGMDKPQSNQN